MNHLVLMLLLAAAVLLAELAAAFWLRLSPMLTGLIGTVGGIAIGFVLGMLVRPRHAIAPTVPAFSTVCVECGRTGWIDARSGVCPACQADQIATDTYRRS